MNQVIVELATMHGEADGLLPADGHGFSGRFVSSNGDERDLARRSLRGVGGKEGKVDLLDDVENCLGLEGRAVQSLLDLGAEASIEGLGIQALEDFASPIANAHR